MRAFSCNKVTFPGFSVAHNVKRSRPNDFTKKLFLELPGHKNFVAFCGFLWLFVAFCGFLWRFVAFCGMWLFGLQIIIFDDPKINITVTTTAK
jgi:hypothetical protein